MRKTHAFGLVIFVVFAFSAIAASSAFALPEIPQWLVSGATISLTTELVNVDILPDPVGELLLFENMALKADILCEIAKALGWLLPDGLGEIVTGECLNAEGMEGCLNEADVTFKPVHLPWQTELLEDEPAKEFLLDITKGNGGAPGWELKCLTIIGEVTESCTTERLTAPLQNLEDGLVLGEFLEAAPVEGSANCGAIKETGLVVGPFLLHALNTAEELLTLAVSLAEEVV